MSCIVCNQPTEPFKSTGKYPKTCSPKCLSVLRGRNGTRNNQKKRGWATYNNGLINKNAQALT